MSKAGKHLDHLHGAATLFLVERRDINAGNHLILVIRCVTNKEDFAISFAKVE